MVPAGAGAEHTAFGLLCAVESGQMTPRQDLGRSQLGRRVLGKVEHLHEVQLRPEYAVGVLVPAAGLPRTLHPVHAGQDRQTDRGTEQRPHDPGDLVVEEHVLDEPVLQEDRGRFMAAADAVHLRLRHAVRDEAGLGRYRAVQPVARAPG